MRMVAPLCDDQMERTEREREMCVGPTARQELAFGWMTMGGEGEGG